MRKSRFLLSAIHAWVRLKSHFLRPPGKATSVTSKTTSNHTPTLLWVQKSHSLLSAILDAGAIKVALPTPPGKATSVASNTSAPTRAIVPMLQRGNASQDAPASIPASVPTALQLSVIPIVGATKVALPMPYQQPQNPANTTTGKATSVASNTTESTTLWV